MSEQLSGLLEEEVVGGDVTKVRGVMYYQFECQNFLTQESLYPLLLTGKKGKRERFLIFHKLSD